MPNLRKLSAFRQLSLNCEPPSAHQRRRTLRKQFSEDLPDADETPSDRAAVRISLSAKPCGRDRPPSGAIKIAWEDSPALRTEEAVIIRRCKEVRRAATGRLSRQTSLEKDSILHSKREIAERLRHHAKDKERHERANLEIFLSHDPADNKERLFQNVETPKLIQPLMGGRDIGKNSFQAQRNRHKHKIDLHEMAYSPTRPEDVGRGRCGAVVVAPTGEKELEGGGEVKAEEFEEMKPINSVIIRPATAASKREKFQKRSNSAFSGTIKESQVARPGLVRSSSATGPRPEHGKSKFVATRRKIRSAKRPKRSSAMDELEGDPGMDGNSTAAVVAEMVTMVSLVSPAGSEGEEEPPAQEGKKCKGKCGGKSGAAKEEPEVQRSMSLRKTVKTVSFQQSSIHAVRSFSASFPARRGSMATAIMSGSDAKTAAPAKTQEKRGTNTSAPDDDERVAKRRLLRSRTEEEANIDSEHSEPSPSQQTDDDETAPPNTNITVDIKSRGSDGSEKIPGETNEDAGNPRDEGSPGEQRVGEPPAAERANEKARYESPKERQCWELHRRMTEKGINVSLDTILRGMLTPTEYRLSRQNSIAAAAAAEAEAAEEAA